VFRGQFEMSLDEKGRLVMPRRYQDDFKPGKNEKEQDALHWAEQEITMTKPPEATENKKKEYGELVIAPDALNLRNCLLVYPVGEWIKVEQQLKRFPATDEKCQSVKTVFGLASDVEMDDKGRFIVPAYLLEHIGLEKKAKHKGIYLIGQQNKFELWDKALWQAEYDKAMNVIRKAREEAGKASELPSALLSLQM